MPDFCDDATTLRRPRQPAVGWHTENYPGVRFGLLLVIGVGTLAALAGCGDDDKYKPGGGYTFPGKNRDGKGFGGGSRV